MTQIEQTAQSLGRLSEKYRKPIFCSFIGGSLVLEGEQKLNALRIPSFRFPERAIWAIGKMWQFKKYQNNPAKFNPSQIPPVPNLSRLRQKITVAAQSNEHSLNNLEANEIISIAGISTPKTAVVQSIEEAKIFSKSYGYPVVCKLSSRGLLHKKEIGGVITNIETDNQLETAWSKLKQGDVDPAFGGVDIQIQKEVNCGVEVIIGVKQDPTFGPVLLFGAGGSLAEVIEDRNLHLLPIDLTLAKQLVGKSKISTVLFAASGNSPYAIEKLYKTIVCLGQLATEVPEISEIEINPAIVTEDDVWAVDCKVVI